MGQLVYAEDIRPGYHAADKRCIFTVRHYLYIVLLPIPVAIFQEQVLLKLQNIQLEFRNDVHTDVLYSKSVYLVALVRGTCADGSVGDTSMASS